MLVRRASMARAAAEAKEAVAVVATAAAAAAAAVVTAAEVEAAGLEAAVTVAAAAVPREMAKVEAWCTAATVEAERADPSAIPPTAVAGAQGDRSNAGWRQRLCRSLLPLAREGGQAEIR